MRKAISLDSGELSEFVLQIRFRLRVDVHHDTGRNPLAKSHSLKALQLALCSINILQNVGLCSLQFLKRVQDGHIIAPPVGIFSSNSKGFVNRRNASSCRAEETQQSQMLIEMAGHELNLNELTLADWIPVPK